MNVFLPPLLLGETKRRVARLTTHSCVIAGLDPQSIQLASAN